MKFPFKKLKTDTGATMLTAMALLLVVMLVSFVVLAATNTSTRTVSSHIEKDSAGVLALSCAGFDGTYEGRAEYGTVKATFTDNDGQDTDVTGDSALYLYYRTSADAGYVPWGAKGPCVDGPDQSLTVQVRALYGDLVAYGSFRLCMASNVTELKFNEATLTHTYDGAAWTPAITAAAYGSSADSYKYEVKNANGTYTEVAVLPALTDAGSVTVRVTAHKEHYDDRTDTFTYSVTPREITLTSPDKEKTYDGTALTTAATDVTQTGTFPAGQGVTITMTGTQTAVGSSQNTFTYTLTGGAKAANYKITTTCGTLKVTKSSAMKLSYSGDTTFTYDGTAHGGPVTAEAVGNTTITYSTDGGKTWSSDCPTLTDAGILSVTAKAENESYETKTYDYTLTVNKNTNPITVTVTGGNSTVTYDGEAHTVGYTLAATGDSSYNTTAYVSFTGSQSSLTGTNVADSGTLTLKAEDFKNTNQNYTNVTFEVDRNITLTINRATDLNLTVGTATFTYNGKAQGATATAALTGGTVPAGTTVSYSTDDGESWSSTCPTLTDAGELSVQVKAESPNYVTYETGYTLTVNPKAVTVTVTGKSDSDNYTYNGQKQWLTGYSLSCGDSLYSTDDVEYIGASEPSVSGTNAGTYTLTPDENSYSNTNPNFDVTFAVESGTLKINPRSVTVKVTGNTGTKTYNKTAQSVTGYTLACEDTLYNTAGVSYSGTAKATGTNAGSYAMNLDKNKFSNSNTNFTVSFTIVSDGKLTIDKATGLTVTYTDPTEKEYDGTALGTAAKAKLSDGTVPAGTTVSYSTDGGTTWSETVPTYSEAGSYSVQVRATNPNYSDTATCSYTLTLHDSIAAVYNAFRSTVSGTITVESGKSFSVSGNRYSDANTAIRNAAAENYASGTPITDGRLEFSYWFRDYYVDHYTTPASGSADLGVFNEAMTVFEKLLKESKGDSVAFTVGPDSGIEGVYSNVTVNLTTAVTTTGYWENKVTTNTMNVTFSRQDTSYTKTLNATLSVGGESSSTLDMGTKYLYYTDGGTPSSPTCKIKVTTKTKPVTITYS